MAKNGKPLNLWLPEGYDEKINQLVLLLSERGVDLTDPNRGVPSKSALFRHLIDEQLEAVREEIVNSKQTA